jgi:hypothetical protein
MKFIFCEGLDDVAVIRGVASSIGLNDIRIEPFLGKNRLQDFLKEVKTRPEFAQNRVTAIGIIRDADDNGNAAFQSVHNALLVNDFAAPNRNGAFVSNGIKTGILIVGPKAGNGMVEDLCLNSVSNRPEFSCIDDYFNCITEKSGRKNFSSKAKVRVWMASHLDYELYVGKAAMEGYWPWESPAFDSMKQFLQQL